MMGLVFDQVLGAQLAFARFCSKYTIVSTAVCYSIPFQCKLMQCRNIHAGGRRVVVQSRHSISFPLVCHAVSNRDASALCIKCARERRCYSTGRKKKRASQKKGNLRTTTMSTKSARQVGFHRVSHSEVLAMLADLQLITGEMDPSTITDAHYSRALLMSPQKGRQTAMIKLGMVSFWRSF